MQLRQRHLLILQYLIEFKQLKSGHIQSWVFPSNTTTNPMYRSLNWLKAAGYIVPLEQPLIGGNKGGGSQYVWQLGPAGWRHAGYEDRYRPARAIQAHTLAIADLYGLFVRLEQAGYLRIVSYSTEPAVHFDVKDGSTTYYVRPDIRIEWTQVTSREPVRRFIEIDMGSQYETEIRKKLSRYYSAYGAADPNLWPPDQHVMFVTVDERRAGNLRSMLRRQSEDEQALFLVHTTQSLEAQLTADLSTVIGVNSLTSLLYRV